MTRSNNYAFPSLLFAAAAAMLFGNPLQAVDAGAEVSVIRSDAAGIELHVGILDLSINPDVQTGGEFVDIQIAGETNGGAPGYPELPHISRLFAVPPDAAVELEWTGTGPRIVADATPSVGQAFSPDFNKVTQLSPHYTANLWPQNVVEMGDPAVMRGVRLVRVTVNPVQFDPARNELLVWDEVQVKLNFTAGEAINPVIDPLKPRPSSQALRMVRSLVMNPQDVRRDDDGGGKGAIVYVIPDFDGVEAAISPLVDWRRRQGYPCEVIVVAEDATNVQVKNALLSAYRDWEIPPEIVVLIGDADLENADFRIPTWDVGRAYMWETDYKFALLEGQDLLPEVAIGRISARSVAELRNVVAKIHGYETTPDMEDPSWFRRAALMANDPRTGYSSIYLQRWARKMLMEVGFAEVDTFYFIHEQTPGHNFIRDRINEGITLFNYRGWGAFNGAWGVGDARELRNGQKLPLLILPTCNTGDFADHIQNPHAYSEDFLWARDGGCIGAIGSSGFTHTNYNNVLDGGILNGLFRDGAWQIGWALNRGKLELYRHFGQFDDVEDPQVNDLRAWEAHAYQYNLIGDPASELWTAIPTLVNVSHPAQMSIGENRLSVRVTTDEDDPQPVKDVVVTLMQDGETKWMGKTDLGGVVEFTFQPSDITAGAIAITASKHDVHPYMGEITVEQSQYYLGFSSVVVDDDRAGRSAGNGDGVPSPGERIELRTFVVNRGADTPNGACRLNLTAVLGDIEIIDGEVTWNNAPAGGDSALATFVVQIGQLNRDGARLLMHLDIENGDYLGGSAIELKTAAPDLQYVSHRFTPDPFNTGDTAWVDVTLRNAGRVASDVLQATLTSGRSVVNVFNDRAEIPAIDPESADSQSVVRFRIHAHTLTVPGTKVNMTIHFEAEAGFRDDTEFSFVVGSPGQGTPFGPDAYGYVCFDDTDTDWEEAVPVYDWVEIDPAEDGPGIDTGIEDHGNEQDWSTLINLDTLDFHFQYYGQEFDLLTICSNGWFAFGDESKLADFQNRRIPPALGPRGQVCVFWDDLVNYLDQDGNQIGGVYYWFDEENHRFIIEWNQMRRYIGHDEDGNLRQGSLNTFQAVIYDPQHYPTPTMDSDIQFQYLEVSNDRDVDPLEFDTPYATVGIVNLNGTDGMEYTYWNEYARGAAQLQSERAIRFSTRLVVFVGFAMGSVRDLETGAPIENAEIRASRGAFALTVEDGSFFMDNIIVDEDYNFTAWAPGYNEQTLAGYDVTQDDTLFLEFSLRHPGFVIDREAIEVSVQPEFGSTQWISLTNSGNGPLEFRSRFDYLGGDENQRWQRILNFNVTEQTGDNRINGVDFFDDDIWVTGSNRTQNPNRFYKFDRQGRLLDYIDQPGVSSYGFRGTTKANELLYGGDLTWILGVNEAGEVMDSIPGPFTTQRALAYDTRRDGFYVANGRSDPIDPITLIDRDGNVIDSWDHELDIQGLGYLPDDTDGYPLYILSRDKTNPALRVPYALVSKLDPVTGDIRVVTPLIGDVEDRNAGMEIVNDFDPAKWVMLAVLNHPSGDRVSAYDLGPNTNWVSYSPHTGTLEAGRDTTIAIILTAAGLIEGDYGLSLIYRHNAAGLSTTIPIMLHVDNEAGVDGEGVIPMEFALNQNYPNPFNAETRITFDLPESGRASLRVFDVSGRVIADLADGAFDAGGHVVTWNSGELPSGVYLMQLESGGRVLTRKLALIR